MGAMCSKNSAEAPHAAANESATKPSGENEETPPSAPEEPPTGNEETVVAIDEEERKKQLANDRTEGRTAEAAPGEADAAAIYGEQVVVEADGSGDARMRVSVTEAVVNNDAVQLPDQTAGLSPEDRELLEKARAQARETAGQGGGGPVVTDITGDAKSKDQNLKPPTASAYGYLLYSEDRGGKLVLFWTKNELTPDEEAAHGQVLLAFRPARHKTVPRMKYEQKGGKTDLLTDISVRIPRDSDGQKLWEVNG